MRNRARPLSPAAYRALTFAPRMASPKLNPSGAGLLQNRRIFLTGGTGMVGRNLIETAPADVEIIAPGRQELDVTDAQAVMRAMEAAQPEMVIHCAGRVGGIAANMADPAAFLAQNLRMGLAVLEAADKLGVRCINMASSCIYPPEAPNPLKEEMLLTGGLEPTNEGYALAKLSVLRLGQYLNRMSGAERIKSLIPCNLYGRHDHFDPISAHLLPAIVLKIHRAATAGGDVEIWGDGSARREFLYAGDAARMVWHAAANFDALPDIMNIGLGQDYSVLDYYKSAADVIGWAGDFTFDTSRPVGMKQKLVDISQQNRLSFPKPSTLEHGIAESFCFFLGTHTI